jgi:hypothetical protein
MRTQRRTVAPPTTTNELLNLLRQTRLLDEVQLHRLADAWDGNDPPVPHADELVSAGLLTSYQAEQLLAGRPRRLRLGPYRLLERLGAGGSGQVFKAEHVLLRRIVALKVLGRENGETCFRQEVETAGRLTHPHIIAAHDACRLRGRMVLVLEHVDGVDLERLVRDTGPLAVDLVCVVLRQAILALGYLHENGLVHRDVKPANLLLANFDAPVVKLLDLGLVCPVGRAGDELCGTPDYIAPERGVSAESTDIRGDLYSLGCTLYQLLTGRVPFPGGNWTGKLIRHRLEVPTPITDLRPDVPDEIVAIVDKLMARDPVDRFANPREVLVALAGDRRGVSPLVGDTNRPQANNRRRWWAFLMPLALTTVLAGGGAGLLARLAIPATRTESSAVSATPASLLDLATLIAQAPDGASIELPDGRHLVSPVHLHGKALTIRSAPGASPVLVRQADLTWDPLIQSDRDVTLEGIALEGGKVDGSPAPLIVVEQAKLIMRNCTLRQRGPAPAVSLRRGSQLALVRCLLKSQVQGVGIEMPAGGTCRVQVHESNIKVYDASGTALLLWGTETSPAIPAEVNLTHSTVDAGRIVACRSLAGPVRLMAEENRLVFHQALVSFDGYGDREISRRLFAWQGRQNRFETTGTWVRLAGRPGPAWDEKAFERWCKHRPEAPKEAR